METVEGDVGEPDEGYWEGEWEVLVEGDEKEKDRDGEGVSEIVNR